MERIQTTKQKLRQKYIHNSSIATINFKQIQRECDLSFYCLYASLSWLCKFSV